MIRHPGCLAYEARRGTRCPIKDEHLHYPYWELLAPYDRLATKMLVDWWPASRKRRAQKEKPPPA